MSLAFAGALNPMLVFVIAGLIGLVRPSDLGVRTALVADNVARDQLVAAMGISRTTSDCARVAGALAGAGMFAAFGMGPAYVAVSSFYALGLLFTSDHRRRRRPAARRRWRRTPACSGRRPGAISREGLAYVWSKPQLLAAMLVAFLVNMTAYPLSNGLLPYVAKDIYGIDQTGLGYLVASFAFGALLGSVALSWRGSGRPARLMIVCGARLVHDAAAVRADARSLRRRHHADARRLYAKLLHGDAGRPAAARRRPKNSAAASWACACSASTACRWACSPPAR